MNTPIYSQLVKHKNLDFSPFHTPGHKNNFFTENLFQLDFTDGFSGKIGEAEQPEQRRMEHQEDGDVKDAQILVYVGVFGEKRRGEADGSKQRERDVAGVAQAGCGDAWAELFVLYIEQAAEKLREKEAYQRDDACGQRDPRVLADIVDGDVLAEGRDEHAWQHDPQDDLAERASRVRRHDARLAENASDEHAKKQF